MILFTMAGVRGEYMASLYYSKLITRTYVMIVTRTETNNLPKNIKVCPTPWVIAYYPDERMAR